ncbi:MAG TPA: DNA-binding protein [Terriglobia bacterium]|nr:DNA-binding protein [Terriglobia bacterium]
MKGLITAAGVVLLMAGVVLSVTGQVGQRGPMVRHYDPKTEVTLTGTVESIDRVGYGNMSQTGLHLTVKVGDETTDVHLGPAAFIEPKMSFKKGDTVQITGSKITMMGKPAVIAREVKKGDQVLTLRDEKGLPVWPRGRRPVS